MTQLAEHLEPTRALRSGAEAAGAEAAAAAAEEAAYPRVEDRTAVGWRVLAAFSVGVALVLLFGVYLFGLSGLTESRKQTTMYKTLQHELATAVAPIAPTGEGKPMAIIDAPEIGVSGLVVVEGTSSRDLTTGPGHQRNTPFPGQAGTVLVYGRRTTFGGPFAHVLNLQVGDIVRVTTGQGVAQYRVSSFGDQGHPPPANSANRLVLLTSDSTYDPQHYVAVSADLVSPVQPSAGPPAAIASNERGLVGDADDALVPLVLWSQALLIVAVGGTVAAHRWSRWPAFLVTAPVVLAVVWNIYENVAVLLPNMF